MNGVRNMHDGGGFSGGHHGGGGGHHGGGHHGGGGGLHHHHHHDTGNAQGTGPDAFRSTVSRRYWGHGRRGPGRPAPSVASAVMAVIILIVGFAIVALVATR
jgi:hypothetical protein